MDSNANAELKSRRALYNLIYASITEIGPDGLKVCKLKATNSWDDCYDAVLDSNYNKVAELGASDVINGILCTYISIHHSIVKRTIECEMACENSQRIIKRTIDLSGKIVETENPAVEDKDLIIYKSEQRTSKVQIKEFIGGGGDKYFTILKGTTKLKHAKIMRIIEHKIKGNTFYDIEAKMLPLCNFKNYDKRYIVQGSLIPNDFLPLKDKAFSSVIAPIADGVIYLSEGAYKKYVDLRRKEIENNDFIVIPGSGLDLLDSMDASKRIYRDLCLLSTVTRSFGDAELENKYTQEVSLQVQARTLNNPKFGSLYNRGFNAYGIQISRKLSIYTPDFELTTEGFRAEIEDILSNKSLSLDTKVKLLSLNLGERHMLSGRNTDKIFLVGRFGGQDFRDEQRGTQYDLVLGSIAKDNYIMLNKTNLSDVFDGVIADIAKVAYDQFICRDIQYDKNSTAVKLVFTLDAVGKQNLKLNKHRVPKYTKVILYCGVEIGIMKIEWKA